MLTSAFGVRRDKAALSQWVKIPPGNLLQPEATGATVEVTKRLKPAVKRAANMVASSRHAIAPDVVLSFSCMTKLVIETVLAPSSQFITGLVESATSYGS